jgi:HTH-type transcriptional regulator / antitoxin HigA
MDRDRPTALEPARVLHPGETVLEYLDFYGWSQRDLARRTGLAPKTISEICSGKAPVTPPTALLFEKVFQRPAQLWLNLQLHFDEAEARRRQSAKSGHWTEWARHFPVREMKRLKFSLPPGCSDADVLLNFFGVSSPESWNSVWTASEVAYRQTRALDTREESIAAWVREAELMARGLELAEFDSQRLRASLAELRALTRRRAGEIMEPSQRICARAGLALVWVPELRNTSVSGCAKWLTEKKALVGLTLRYKTDDRMWFALFHEIGHILLHKNKRSFVIDNAAEDLSDRVIDPEMQQYEAEANRFSADTLIPPRALAEFIHKQVFTNESIHDFAERIGVGPGIVVGRLQFEGVLGRHQGNALKQKLDWNFVEIAK